MKLLLVLVSMLLTQHSVKGQCTNVNNCDSCSNPEPECQECVAKKVLSEDRKQCLDCPTDCAVCVLDDNGDPTCTECESGYLNDGACTACELENCMRCDQVDDEETCTKCEGSGFSLSGGKCTGCPDGKYSDSGSCKACPSKALKCTTGPTVTECEEDGVGYVKSEDSSSCIQCPADCVACALGDTAAECTQCKENRRVDDGNCVYCDGDSSGVNCKSCGDDGVCTECNTKYILEDGTCKDCPANCDECASDENSSDLTCEKCTEEYGLNGVNKFCTSCPSKCSVCEFSATASDNKNCLECEAGSFKAYKDASNEMCYDAPASPCASYVTSGAGTFVPNKPVPQCASCASGYDHFAGDNVCVSCTDTGVTGGDPNCAACTATGANAVTCDMCKAGYDDFDDSGNGNGVVCVSCTDTGVTGGNANCDACSATGANAVTCSMCKAGYDDFDDSGNGNGVVCVSCTTATNGGEASCASCDASNTNTVECTSCSGDYKLYKNSDAEKCTKCPTGCDECSKASNKVTCDTCSAGYRMKYSGGSAAGSCTKCSVNCEQCTTNAADNTEECTDCKDDGFKLIEKECVACPENCRTCDDGSTCTDCHDEYGLAGGSCVACIANCNDCDANDQGEHVCDTCNAGYYVSDAQCVDCTPNCLECEYDAGVMVCGECDDLYVRTDGECKKCPSNCNECSSTTKCNKGKCTTGFAVNDGGECQDCAGLTGIANCGTCEEKADANSTASCTACAAGYTLKDGLQSGNDAECVSVSELNCQGSPFADSDWQCAENSCTSDTVLTADKLCGRRCYVCGEYENDVFVEVDKCKTDNETGTAVLCPSGFCAVKGFEEDGKTMVAGGCLPQHEASSDCSLENVECQNRGSGDDEVRQCSVCCGDNFCSNESLKGVKEQNHATTALVSMMLLVGSVAITIVLP